MKNLLDKNKLALTLAIFFSVVHLVWIILVAVIPNPFQLFINWVFRLHAINPCMVLASPTVVNSVILVILTFIVGYVIGFVFATFWNLVNKK